MYYIRQGILNRILSNTLTVLRGMHASMCGLIFYVLIDFGSHFYKDGSMLKKKHRVLKNILILRQEIEDNKYQEIV